MINQNICKTILFLFLFHSFYVEGDSDIHTILSINQQLFFFGFSCIGKIEKSRRSQEEIGHCEA